MDLAAGLHAARTRLPVPGDLLQGLYREDLRPRNGICTRQRRAQPRARTDELVASSPNRRHVRACPGHDGLIHREEFMDARREGMTRTLGSSGADGSPSNPYISLIMTV